MATTLICGELRTGRILATVPTANDGSSWSTVLNDAGDVTAQIPLRHLEPRRRRELLSFVEITRCFLAAVTGDGAVLEAGPIWKHKFDDATGRLTVGAAGLASLWDHRLVVPVLTAGQRVQDAVLTYSGLSLGTIAKRLVQAAIAHTGGSVPVDLPEDFAGTATRTYYGYELAATGERLQQLTEVDGGPDVAFQPYLTTDGLFLRWQMRHGTTSDPLLHQVGEDWQFDRGVARGELRLLSVDVDGSKMANRAWAAGDGQERDMLVGTAADTTQLAAGYPLLEARTSRSSVVEQATIDGHATALLDGSLRPWQTWSVQTSDRTPSLGLYRPGDWATMHIPDGHEYLRAGPYRTRILSISGGLDRMVKIGLAPTMEAR